MKLQLVLTIAVVLVAGSQSSSVFAAPFYYYFADDAAAATQNAQQQAQDVAGQAQQVGGQAQEAASNAAQQAQDKASSATGSGEAPIRERFSGHMTDLYTHGSSAMKGLVDTVQPDIKNIGKDLTDVYQQTRDQMGKKIEPLAQTVRPYIDQAQKAVAPYVSKAREEIPKAMTKVGTAVMSKISGNQQAGSEGQFGEQMQHMANSVQKEAGKATQEVADAAQQQQ